MTKANPQVAYGMVVIAVLVTFVVGTTGCHRLVEAPGFRGIPMHPKATEVSQSEGRVEYWLRGVDQNEALEFYLRQMKRNGWTLIEQWGGALLYEREDQRVLLAVSGVSADTKVTMIQGWEPRRPPE